MKIKIPGFAIEDPEIRFVSLVKRGANREPFRILKSEDASPGGHYKAEEFFNSAPALVKKVEGTTVEPSTGGKPAQGATTMAARKLREAVPGDLDGLTVAKAEDSPEAPIEAAVTAPAEVAKDCSDGPAHSSEVDHPTSSGATDDPDPEDADKAGDKKKKKSAPPWAKSEVMVAKAGDKDYAYALNEDGIPTFIEWLDVAKVEEEPVVATVATPEATSVVSQDVLLKAIADLTALVADNQKQIISLQKSDTPEPKRPVVRLYESDLDESLATPGMANGRRRLVKSEPRESVFAGLIPEFDAIERRGRM